MEVNKPAPPDLTRPHQTNSALGRSWRVRQLGDSQPASQYGSHLSDPPPHVGGPAQQDGPGHDQGGRQLPEEGGGGEAGLLQVAQPGARLGEQDTAGTSTDRDRLLRSSGTNHVLTECIHVTWSSI